MEVCKKKKELSIDEIRFYEIFLRKDCLLRMGAENQRSLAWRSVGYPQKAYRDAGHLAKCASDYPSSLSDFAGTLLII